MMRAKFTSLIEECRQMVVSHLTPLFSNLFENADVVLLEFAEKAESNQAQQRFFEAMKEIQVKRPMMEQVFQEELQACFRRFKDSSYGGPSTDGIFATEGGQAFTLVDHDTIEETVALQNMTTKALLNFAYEIHALRQRLALVIGGRKLEENEIPGGPRQLGECYRAAARQLALEPKVKIVVFVLFDKFVMSQLAGLYQEYNSRLVEAGLLPHLKYEVRKAPDQGVGPPQKSRRGSVAAPAGVSAASSMEGGNAGGQTIGEEMFDAICHLLAGRRQATGRPDTGTGDARQETLTKPMLVSAITQLQQADHDSPVARETLDTQLIPDIQLDTQLIDNIKLTLVQQREKLFGGVDRRRVASRDADVIDLVGMIFEYMLNDETIPNAVKALLSRLHTPFLKIAILDKQFFTQEDHPVRQLLNTMAEAGARYVVESDLKRGIFPYMRAAVNRILDEFDDQMSVFAEVLAEFEARLEQMRHTAEVTEQRTREAASGQEKLQYARQRARGVIDAEIRGKTLPPAIVQLLRQVWADKLMFILLRDREGEQSTFWKLAVRVADDIIWSTELRTSEAGRQELRDRLPELQVSLRQDLERLANFGSDDVARLYELIADSQYAALDSRQDEQARQQTEASVGLQSAAQAADNPLPAVEEAAGATASSPKEEALHQQLANIEFGTWFEFTVGENQPRQRLKLAWYTQVAGHYMFVDSLGVKAAVKSRDELAREMVVGKARILVQDKRPFVDRAMETVRNLLRRGEKISA
jgi:hypothetical protein